MVDNMNTTNRGLEKAQQRFEQAKQALAKDLVQYDMTRAELRSLLSEGEKISPKAWRKEKEQLEREHNLYGQGIF